MKNFAFFSVSRRKGVNLSIFSFELHEIIYHNNYVIFDIKKCFSKNWPEIALNALFSTSNIYQFLLLFFNSLISLMFRMLHVQGFEVADELFDVPPS